ncbi:hypothetical protein SF1_01060 [Sphingobacterium faecium NBRC 15299]|uniref:hypothetical protein n=1 Tax=Sphingobacterium faecium TaxID=34087 RepID=UPI000D39D2A5|nr:hypothetical protein [Sphingobacterium faecium]PTX12416.1 hypothetical protein C8N37_102110 [Sphingobacterium faecium]GEM62124.1 hypothetical protein SF1_01060 [Sphingobacterium faecium NBRC 15299]
MTLTTSTDIQKKQYKIADIILQINYPIVLDLEKLLPTFRDFEWREHSSNPVIQVNLTTDKAPVEPDMGMLRSDLSISWGDRFCFYEKEEGYITTIVNEQGNELWYLYSERNFAQSTVYIPESNDYEQSTVICWMLMMIFGQAALLHEIIMIHGSVINLKGQGIAFLGKSGTGKSTHSRLWLNHIAETSLLNDDNPAIRVTARGVLIYGTPWSGKTPCYKNEAILLKAFVRLQQAPENKFEALQGVKGFIAVLPSCSAIRWNKDLFAEMNTTLEKVIAKVPVGFLKCLPDQEAAQLCHDRIVDIAVK